MKLPKYFFKLDTAQQEAYLVRKIQEIHKEEEKVMKLLSSVRGGYKFEAPEIDRLDLLEMKAD